MSSFEDQYTLLEQLKAGNAAAIECIYITYRKWLYVVALGILQHSSDAEELVQDFFIEMWERGNGKEFSDIGQLKNYLYVCVRNRCFNRLETNRTQRKRLKKLLPEEDLTLPSNHLENTELQRQLNEAISKLPPVRSRVFQMGYLLQRSRKEIAAAMGISQESVKKHIALALKDLRLALKNRYNH